MVLNIHRNHKPYQGRGEGGGTGEWKIIYLSLHCHPQNNSCIKMGSDESHFNVSLIVRDKGTRPQLLKRKDSRSGFEPRSLCLPAERLTARPNRLTRRINHPTIVSTLLMSMGCAPWQCATPPSTRPPTRPPPPHPPAHRPPHRPHPPYEQQCEVGDKVAAEDQRKGGGEGAGL